MFNSLKLLLHIDTTLKFNGIIYFLKQMPLVKKLFKNTKYEHYTAKKGFTIAAVIYSILHILVTSACLICLGILIPLIYVSSKYESADLNYIFNYVFLLLYFLLPACNVKILDPDRRKLICIKVLKMNPRKYIIADYFPKEMVRLVLEIPAYCLIAWYFDLSYPILLLLACSKHFMAMFYEFMHIVYYEKKKKILAKKYYITIIYSFAILLLTYIFAMNNMVLILPETVMVVIAVLSILLGLYGAYGVLNYQHYDAAVNEANLISDFAIDKTQVNAQANFRAVKMKDKDFDGKDVSAKGFEKIKGYDYLNAIFFKRHKRILYRPIIIQLVIIGILFICGLFGVLLSDEFQSTYVSELTAHFSYVIFLLYIMSTGSNATKAMFYNCDISLLRYGFYRERKSLLKTFAIRLRYLIATNLIPAFCMAAGLLILGVIAGGEVMDMVPVAIFILIMAMFFSVHYLFLYYIFQPYTTDLAIKNPFFSIINFVMYMLCYGCIQIDSAPANFLLFTAIGTIVYMAVALLLVYRLAEKTFRLR